MGGGCRGVGGRVMVVAISCKPTYMVSSQCLKKTLIIVVTKNDLILFDLIWFVLS